ncbi:hypothetical protein FBU30_005276 [Linnemannia zychae]|nr:hypothetical protein FBU30_005276 [Linnemannia zychae]
MTIPFRTGGRSFTLILFTLLLTLLGAVMALDPQFSVPTATTTSSQTFNLALLRYPPRPTITALSKRQGQLDPGFPGIPSTGGNSSSSSSTLISTSQSPISTPAINTTTAIPTANTTIAITTASRTVVTTSVNSTSIIATATTPASPTPTESKSDSGPLIIGGSVVGGLVFAIGLALVIFKCTVNRREKHRRNKEMAATLAENFDRSAGDPIASPRKGYMELGEGPPTPSPGRGANLSRNGSQDAYYGKEGIGGQDYYNPHYVQERYGSANTGGGYFDETEMSVMGGHTGRPASPFVGRNNSDHSMAYPPTSIAANHYAGYNEYGHNGDYDYHGGHQDGGYYGGGNRGRPQGY